MLRIDEIELNFEPRNKIVPHLQDGDKAEELADKMCAHGIAMTAFESAFMCGALKKFKPTKILEIGVEAGGSSAIILQCLEDIGQPYVLHSVDLNVKIRYGAGQDDVGSISKYVKENNFITPPHTHCSEMCGKHFEHYGTILPLIIDEIGGDIDFVILDTMHTLPGEVLEFLAFLPYLKKDACVVLHDVFWNQIKYDFFNACATGELFGAVKAEKFLNLLPDNADLIYRYPNIAAFQINDQTMENIADVFLMLAIRWNYFPSRYHLRAYYKILQKHYPPELCDILKNFIKANYLNLRISDEIHNHSKNI